MYAVIHHPEKQSLPTVVNMNSENYPTFIMAGYEPIQTGTKRDMYEVYENLITEFASIDHD